MRFAALLTCCMLLMASMTNAAPDETHKALSEAAEYAASFGNVELLSSLLKAGLQVNEPVNREQGWTVLHCAAVHNKIRVARFLVDNGAYLDVRDKWKRRPIDIALKDDQKDLCEVLAQGDAKEHEVDGIPAGVIEELLVDHDEVTNLVFVSFNEKDPSEEMDEYLGTVWTCRRPFSSAVKLSQQELNAAKVPSVYREKASGRYGAKVWLNLRRKSDVEYVFEVGQASGPLAGAGGSGSILRRYGYWIKVKKDSWIS